MSRTRRPSLDGVTRDDVGADEVRTTGAERLLAVVLAVFVSIGLLWAYSQPLDRTDDGPVVERCFDAPDCPVPGPGAPAAERAVFAYERASEDLGRQTFVLEEARRTEELRREEYRTELDAGAPAEDTEAAYRTAQAATVAAQESLSEAEAEVTALRPAYDEAQDVIDERGRTDRIVTFVLRLVWTLGVLALALVWSQRLTGRRSRWQPLSAAVVAAATLQALVMAADYLGITQLAELGPLVLSLLGVAVTVAAFVAYQRWLARRLAPRRVRKQECPYCGHPAEHGSHCAGCGRAVLAPCAVCAEPRRVGSRFCTACGTAGVAPSPAPVGASSS